MTQDEFNVLSQGIPDKIQIDHQLFMNWMSKAFKIKNMLNSKFEKSLMDYFYIVIVQIVLEGIPYTERISKNVDDKEEGILFMRLLNKHISNIFSKFSDKENEFINYRRDSAAHIFVTSYENRIQNGKVVTNRKGRNITDINEHIYDVILEHGTELEFDKYFLKNITDSLDELSKEIKELRKGSLIKQEKEG